MKQNSATMKIILQRENEIAIKQNILEQYQKNVKNLEDIIEQKKDYLKSYKNTLEVIPWLYCSHNSWPAHQCYFCKKNPWQKIRLADGCMVPACGICHARIIKDRKLAEERGHYDPSKIARIIESGGDRMKVEKGATDGNNLKVAHVLEKKLTKLKITDEGEMITYQPKDGDKNQTASTKLVVGISYEGMQDGDPDRWSMNNTTRNTLIDIYGDDTAKWVDKEPEIQLEGTGEYRHIVIDTLRTK